ncbi:hypothetical protein GYMLUDRAFT_40237 [Collybiopsis luxurians FD-317 M1]|uniref:Uncharacterized protein n=1 Tax=Collybiopsis luxurians FD-317 M1 TaxID=944289 RepID=A0A0D0C798_9AGAR|nr:hypothetical protein GYMLUDRAFT_40237 [Collybiopsis luxurians FD-317 M1]
MPPTIEPEYNIRLPDEHSASRRNGSSRFPAIRDLDQHRNGFANVPLVHRIERESLIENQTRTRYRNRIPPRPSSGSRRSINRDGSRLVTRSNVKARRRRRASGAQSSVRSSDQHTTTVPSASVLNGASSIVISGSQITFTTIAGGQNIW